MLAFRLSSLELYLTKEAEQAASISRPALVCLPLQLKHETTGIVMELFLSSSEE